MAYYHCLHASPPLLLSFHLESLLLLLCFPMCDLFLSFQISFDFLDINCGCPIDLVYNKGMGSALLERVNRLEVRLSFVLYLCLWGALSGS